MYFMQKYTLQKFKPQVLSYFLITVIITNTTDNTLESFAVKTENLPIWPKPTPVIS